MILNRQNIQREGLIAAIVISQAVVTYDTIYPDNMEVSWNGGTPIAGWFISGKIPI